MASSVSPSASSAFPRPDGLRCSAHRPHYCLKPPLPLSTDRGPSSYSGAEQGDTIVRIDSRLWQTSPFVLPLDEPLLPALRQSPRSICPSIWSVGTSSALRSRLVFCGRFPNFHVEDRQVGVDHWLIRSHLFERRKKSIASGSAVFEHHADQLIGVGVGRIRRSTASRWSSASSTPPAA